MLHELGIHADGGEAGEGVDLVDHHPVGTMLHKEIAAGQALAVQGGVGHGGVGLDLVQLFHTSSSYAKWNQENESSAYMRLFAVAYGKPLFVTSSCQMTAKRLDIDHKNCLHAKAGSSLRADEIVFYDERAMVMNYLVEFSA